MKFACLFAFALATPALAQEAAPASPAAPKEEKKVCRSVTATGSIMPKRECHTKAEWQAMSDRSTAAREKLDRDYGGRTGGMGLSSASGRGG